MTNELELLRAALKEIQTETTEDIAGLSHDEALNLITWIRERAKKVLEEVKP